MITENDPIIPRKVDLDKNPKGTELKVAEQKEREKLGRYYPVRDLKHTLIFVRNGEDPEKRISSYLEKVKNRPQKWN